MKKSFGLISLILIILLAVAFAQEDLFQENQESATSEQTITLEQPPEDSLIPATEEEPAIWDISNQNEDEYLQVNDITNDIQVNTVDGSIADFNMVNSLFYLGSLIQGSFISFENNNNILFSSLFDRSKFTATLDEEGELNVGQRNGNGELGRVYITINNGNLTQDEYVVFTPEGNEPTYIYYNTTEIEFKDGNVSLLGETVSNNDDSREKTKVQFNENGFTKVELPVENTYTINDFSIINIDDKALIICKKDPLCDINIDESSFTIKGKVNFSYKEKLIYESFDENNEAKLDFSENKITFNNPLPKSETLSIFYLGHLKIIEKAENIYFIPLEELAPNNFLVYKSLFNQKTIYFEDNALYYENLAVFNPDSTKYQECLNNDESCVSEKSVIQSAPSIENNSWIIFLIIAVFILISLIFLFQKKPKKKLRKKGQFTLFVVLGIFIVTAFILFFVFGMTKYSSNELVTIESLDDASSAVEVCIEDVLQNEIANLGYYGGYTSEQDSSFGTTNLLLSLDEMETNLEVSITEEISACENVLEGTPYDFVSERRIDIEVNFEDSISIEGDSIGKVQNNAGLSQSIPKINFEYEVNMVVINSIINEFMSSESETPILSYDGYKIDIFSNEDYDRVLIEVQQDNPYFKFRITKDI